MAPQQPEEHDDGIADGAGGDVGEHLAPGAIGREGDRHEDVAHQDVEQGHPVEGEEHVAEGDLLGVGLGEELLIRPPLGPARAGGRLPPLEHDGLPRERLAQQRVRVGVVGAVPRVEDGAYDVHLPKGLVEIVVHDAVVDRLVAAHLDLHAQDLVQRRDDSFQEVLVRQVRAMHERTVLHTVQMALVRAPVEAQPLPRAVEDEAERLGQMAQVGRLAIDEEEEHQLEELRVVQPVVARVARSDDRGGRGGTASGGGAVGTLGARRRRATTATAARRHAVVLGIRERQLHVAPPALKVAEDVRVQLRHRAMQLLVEAAPLPLHAMDQQLADVARLARDVGLRLLRGHALQRLALLEAVHARQVRRHGKHARLQLLSGRRHLLRGARHVLDARVQQIVVVVAHLAPRTCTARGPRENGAPARRRAQRGTRSGAAPALNHPSHGEGQRAQQHAAQCGEHPAQRAEHGAEAHVARLEGEPAEVDARVARVLQHQPDDLRDEGADGTA